MTTLSCGMIVRNAESSLRRVLESVRPHVDQLVIVDTGSTDSTCEIALQYADSLTGIRWPDSFAAARNTALDLCTGDWVMYLDADDELLDGPAIRTAIEQASSQVAMFLLRYVTSMDAAGNREMEFWRERVVRQGFCRWVGRAHEVLFPVQQGHYQRLEGPWVLHHGHGNGRASLQRNVQLLRLDLAENSKETRTLFYLGRDLILLGKIHEGRRLLQRYMKSATWADEMYIAQSLISYCYRTAGLYREAFDADIQLLYINPLWPGAYLQLAQDCYFLKQWERSVHFCEIGQALPIQDTNLFISHSAYTYEWMIYQVVALSQVGRVEEAAALTERALAILPTDPMHLANKAYFAQLAQAS